MDFTLFLFIVNCILILFLIFKKDCNIVIKGGNIKETIEEHYNKLKEACELVLNSGEASNNILNQCRAFIQDTIPTNITEQISALTQEIENQQNSVDNSSTTDAQSSEISQPDTSMTSQDTTLAPPNTNMDTQDTTMVPPNTNMDTQDTTMGPPDTSMNPPDTTMP